MEDGAGGDAGLGAAVLAVHDLPGTDVPSCAVSAAGTYKTVRPPHPAKVIQASLPGRERLLELQ